MSKEFICKGCGEKFKNEMQSNNDGYCYICNEFYMRKYIADLEAKLSEKEKEIKNKEDALKTLIVSCCHRCKDKIKFAVEQLEKLRESVSDSIEERNGCMYAFMGYLDEIEHEKIDEIIDNQIKELKGEK